MKIVVPISREEMIASLVDDVDNWDVPNLINWVKHQIRERLEGLEDSEIMQEYCYEFGVSPYIG